jgi:hypothetical protein
MRFNDTNAAVANYDKGHRKGNLMGQILNIKNLKSYINHTEEKTKWYVYELLQEKFTVLSLRCNENDNDGPLCWRDDRNLDYAIDLTLKLLKKWQVYRPFSPDKIIKNLKLNLPQIILKLQRQLLDRKLKDLWHLNESQRDEVVIIMSVAVAEICSYKNDASQPMIGSKILHFLLPEFFPVWDTEWIKDKGLRNESIDISAAERVHDRLNGQEAAIEYASYLTLMLKEFAQTPAKEYKKLKNTCLMHSSSDMDGYAQLWPKVVEWNFYNLGPLLFEVCLLGKHC